jgi:hypothetical protein
MTVYIKPSPKELVKHPDLPGFTCSTCGSKYQKERSKINCENWHAALTGTEN